MILKQSKRKLIASQGDFSAAAMETGRQLNSVLKGLREHDCQS